MLIITPLHQVILPHDFLVHKLITTGFQYDWLTEVSRVLKFILDYSEEAHHDTLIRNPSVQLCLSIQNSLGYKGDGHPRAFSAKLAWISLQIRNCVVLMTMAANMKVPDPEQQKKISGLEDAGVWRDLDFANKSRSNSSFRSATAAIWLCSMVS